MCLLLSSHRQDCTFTISTGKLTVILVDSEAESVVQSFISLLWDGGDPSALASLQRGKVCVHGRDVKEWDRTALRQRIALLRDSDGDLPLDIGLLIKTIKVIT